MYVLHANLELLVMNVLLVGLLFAFNLRYWKPKLFNPLSAIHILVMLGSVFEMFAFIADGYPELIWLNYVSNMLYFITIAVLGACMLVYGSEEMPKPIWRNRTQHVLMMVPVAFEILCVLSAPATGLIFSVDEAGFYHRSGTFFLQLIPYGYLLASSFYGIYWYVKSETTREKNQYLALSLFAVPPFFLGGIQLMIKANSLDILEFSISLSLLANYAISQNNRITRDPLTRLPNREVLDTVLVEKMHRKRDDFDNLFVMMCDLDGFKKINDTYGHLEGDRALIITADVLYDVCRKHRATATRFGGDEFTIIIEAPTEEGPQKLFEEIEAELKERSKDEKYELRMSAGYTISRTGDTVSDILKAADRELYRVKQERKAAQQQKPE